jgi:hypothetical protein
MHRLFLRLTSPAMTETGQCGQSLLDFECRSHRPLRVVLVHGRNPEQREHGIPHELLDQPSVVLDDL